MLKKLLTLTAAGFLSFSAIAEVKGFFSPAIGFADTDWESDVYISITGGIRFTEHIELEVGYNNYGDSGPFEIEVTSLSYGLNLGGPVSETVNLFVTAGAERLKADDSVSFGFGTVEIDEESTEAYFGVGASFQQSENVAIRTKLVSHDSGDLTTLNVGFVFFF